MHDITLHSSHTAVTGNGKKEDTCTLLYNQFLLLLSSPTSFPCPLIKPLISPRKCPKSQFMKTFRHEKALLIRFYLNCFTLGLRILLSLRTDKVRDFIPVGENLAFSVWNETGY